MNSTTMIVLVILATSALVQGIAIGSKTAATAGTAVVSSDKGIAVQSGFDGYISVPKKASTSTWLGLFKSNLKGLKDLMKPFTSVFVGFKPLKVVVQLFVALVVGVFSTIAMCSFTPLCVITPGDSLKKLSEVSVKDRIAAMIRAYKPSEPMNTVVTDLATTVATNALQDILGEAAEPAADEDELENDTES